MAVAEAGMAVAGAVEKAGEEADGVAEKDGAAEKVGADMGGGAKDGMETDGSARE